MARSAISKQIPCKWQSKDHKEDSHVFCQHKPRSPSLLPRRMRNVICSNAQNKSKRQKPLVCAGNRSNQAITSDSIGIGVLFPVDNVPRRSSLRLRNQKIRAIRKIKRSKIDFDLGTGVTDCDEDDYEIKKDDPVARLRNMPEFSMHSDLACKNMFMACLGMQMTTKKIIKCKSSTSSDCNNNEVLEPSRTVHSGTASIKNEPLATSPSSCCTIKSFPKSEVTSRPTESCKETEKNPKISLQNLLEECFLIYPHDLFSHDSTEADKLHFNHNRLLHDIVRCEGKCVS